MKLKQYSKNSAKSVLLFNLILFLSLLFFGCQSDFNPTYTEGQIPEEIAKICKDEYKLDVTTQRVGSTLWVYIPLTDLLHKDIEVNKEKFFSEAAKEKLMNIITSLSRVVLSSDKSPDFYALVASDIKAGIDYTLIGYILDIKKAYAGFIPPTELDRRYVMKLAAEPRSLEDKGGDHLQVFDIQFRDFLAEQISQRINAKFQGEELTKYFKVNSVHGQYKDKAFIFYYDIKQILPTLKPTDIQQEMLKIVAYCLSTYEFKDFNQIGLADLNSGNEVMLGQAALSNIKGL